MPRRLRSLASAVATRRARAPRHCADPARRTHKNGHGPPTAYAGSDEIGKEIVIVGKGDTGTGLSGPLSADGILRAATNRVDDIFDGQIVFDFDAPDSEDVTDLEGVSGPGDSGGPAFLEANGTRYVVGISVA